MRFFARLAVDSLGGKLSATRGFQKQLGMTVRKIAPLEGMLWVRGIFC